MWKKLFFLKPDKGLNIEKCTNWGIFDFFVSKWSYLILSKISTQKETCYKKVQSKNTVNKIRIDRVSEQVTK